MPTVWETVTSNSSLPVEAGNNFYDHLNNQQGGDVTVMVGRSMQAHLHGGLSASVADSDMSAYMNGGLKASINDELTGIFDG